MIEEILRAGLLARRHTGDVSVMYRGIPNCAQPPPDALSPPPSWSLWRAHNTRRYGHPLAGGPGRSGRGYALSTRVRGMGILRSSLGNSSTVRSPRSPPGRGTASRGRDSLARPSPLRRRPEQGSTPERLARTHVVAALLVQSMADDAVLYIGAVADARAGQQDAPFDGSARPDPAVAPNRDVPRERDVAPDHRVAPDEDVTVDGGRRVDLGVLADP
jgi:hypothetical protein